MRLDQMFFPKFHCHCSKLCLWILSHIAKFERTGGLTAKKNWSDYFWLLFRDGLKCVKVSFPWWHWMFCLCVFLFRYENPLSPLGQHISSELGLTKRHFFEIPTPHCNLDLDEYEYDDDFEWFLFFLFFILQCSCWAPSTLRNTSHAPGLVDKHHQTE